MGWREPFNNTISSHRHPMDPLKQVVELVNHAHSEFADLSDYIWKSPSLIEHETKSELDKLSDYDSISRRMRWKWESNKLEVVFPYLIATGNLFTALSIFESYLLLLAEIVQRKTGIPFSASKGQGVSKLFAYFGATGFSPKKIPIYEQILAAIKIRNCLSHTSGMLQWSRDMNELKRIQKKGIYLELKHRNSRIKRKDGFDEVIVYHSRLGERLKVTNSYPHYVSGYTRDFFLALCDSVIKKWESY